MADKPVSTDDLKAKLGLKRRERRSVGPLPGMEPEEPETKDAGPSEADVEEARKRAAEAEADSGPAVEDFGLMGQEKTPQPVSSGPQYVVVEGAEGFAGQNAGKLVPMLLGVVLALAAMFFLGRMCGAAASDAETYELYQQEAQQKLDYFKTKTTEGGDNVLQRIEDMKATLKQAEDLIRPVIEKAKSPADFAPLLKQLDPMLGKMKKYQDDKVYFPAPDLLSGMIYNYDVMAEAAKFALNTQLAYRSIEQAFEEARSLMSLAQPAGVTQRTVVVDTEQRDVEMQAWTLRDGEEKKKLEKCQTEKDCPRGFTCNENSKCFAKVPAGKPVWVANATPPGQVEVVDPNDPENKTIEWQMVIKEAGEEGEVRQVPTTQVLSLDLKPAFEQQAEAAKAMVAKRLASIMLEAKVNLEKANWDKLEKVLSSCAGGGSCSFEKK